MVYVDMLNCCITEENWVARLTYSHDERASRFFNITVYQNQPVNSNYILFTFTLTNIEADEDLVNSIVYSPGWEGYIDIYQSQYQVGDINFDSDVLTQTCACFSDIVSTYKLNNDNGSHLTYPFYC